MTITNETFIAFCERKLKEANANRVVPIEPNSIYIPIDNLIVIEALVEARLGKKLRELGSLMGIWSDTLILDTGSREIHITKMGCNYMTTKEVMQLATIIVGELEHKLV